MHMDSEKVRTPPLLEAWAIRKSHRRGLHVSRVVSDGDLPDRAYDLVAGEGPSLRRLATPVRRRLALGWHAALVAVAALVFRRMTERTDARRINPVASGDRGTE